MNVGIATIAAFLLVLPGVAFIVGVNLADKNVREVVFRNTPAELGYVIAVSLFVHLVVAIFVTLVAAALMPVAVHVGWPRLVSLVAGIGRFNAGSVYADYLNVAKSAPDDFPLIVIFSLFYFLVASVAGFGPGFLLGEWVRSQKYPWTRFFAKHRWMLDLLPADETTPVTARAVLKSRFPLAGGDAKEDAKKDEPIIIEGIVRDSYFGADGKLLYIVFKTFNLQKPSGQVADYLAALGATAADNGGHAFDQLLVEGDKIEMVRFSRRPISADIDDRLDARFSALDVTDGASSETPARS